MRTRFLPLAFLALLSATLLAACGGKQSGMDTTTPTSTLGTDSASVQAGGAPADTARLH